MQTITGLSAYLENVQRFGIKPGLERIHALLERVGNPQHQYPIILVGGTNGKGSTCEFLAKLLQNTGKKVGLYTSPHLYMWNERIRVLGDGRWEVRNGEAALFRGAVSNEELNTLFADALPHIQAVAESELGQPTEFEILTFLGLWHFARQKVDAAVVEVGLGGRWDATNATQPTLSVITHVALDHCDRLGSTLQEIAGDKVEIARSGRTLVTAETKPEVLAVFEEHCTKIGCQLVQTAHYPSQSNFQQLNLQTAQTAYRVLCETLDWPFNPKLTIQDSELAVTGRFETIRHTPRVVLDGANNPDGAQILAAQLKNALEMSSKARLFLVLGILLDKDYAAMTEILAPLAHTVIATQSHSPRAAASSLVAQEAKRYCTHVEESATPQTALERAQELAGENDLVCVTGSFYTISEIQR